MEAYSYSWKHERLHCYWQYRAQPELGLRGQCLGNLDFIPTCTISGLASAVVFANPDVYGVYY